MNQANRISNRQCTNQSGFPHLSKVRELREDRRFTLSYTSGNTIYFVTPTENPGVRTLENEKYAKVFGVVYDLLYSHENPEKAKKALPMIMRHRDEIITSDQEKLDVLAQEIQRAQNSDGD